MIRKITEEELLAQQAYVRAFRHLPGRPETYHIVTYGCQMNAHDSEKLAGMLEAMGMTAAPTREEADFVLHNTCCIRDNAERKALGNVTWLKEIKKIRPSLLIGVCGCMVQEKGMAEKSTEAAGELAGNDGVGAAVRAAGGAGGGIADQFRTAGRTKIRTHIGCIRTPVITQS